MVRASLLPSINSWFQAATYQELRRKIPSSVMTPLRVFEMLFYCHLFYVIGDGAGIRISCTHCTGPWPIAPMDWRAVRPFFAGLPHGGFRPAPRAVGATTASPSACLRRTEKQLRLLLA